MGLHPGKDGVGNITTDVDDGYVNWPSIHETNKRFSIVVCPKEGPSRTMAPVLVQSCTVLYHCIELKKRSEQLICLGT